MAESLVHASEDGGHAEPSRAGAYQWAEPMRRTFGFDVLACPRCGARLRLVALIEQSSMVRILRHLGLPMEVPEPRPGSGAVPGTLWGAEITVHDARVYSRGSPPRRSRRWTRATESDVGVSIEGPGAGGTIPNAR